MIALEIHDLSHYKSILCLNGELPELTFFNRFNLPIIAADGAANTLIHMGIRPHMIAGDLDSVAPQLLASHDHLHLPEQNTNDYQKCLNYLQENALLPSIVVGINGGHLDHVLNNINIFMDSSCLLYAPPITGLVIKEASTWTGTLPENTKISLMGIPSAIVSSQGLKWELQHAELTFPGKTSCFNRTQSTHIQLNVHQGSALVLIYEIATHDAGSLLNLPSFREK
jgi:thiamine pyrophosphokinase